MAPFASFYFQDVSPPLPEGTPDDTRLHWAVGPDGNTFYPGGRIATNGIVRDPSALSPSRAPDGQWHIACTNHNFGAAIPNNTVDVYAGPTLDGINPAPQHVDCSAMKTSGVVNWAWAPEGFTDSDGTNYLIVSTSTSGQTVDIATFTTWAIPATNSSLTAWGAPFQLAGLPVGGIDAYIVKIGNVYYAFVKAGTIQMYTATGATLRTASTFQLSAVVPVPDYAPTAGEAPNMTYMGGGVWRHYYDQWNEDGHIKWTQSSDVFATFSNSTYVVCRDRMRHCSIIDIAPEPPLLALVAGGSRKQLAA